MISISIFVKNHLPSYNNYEYVSVILSRSLGIWT